MEVAKLRAIRMMWSQVVRAFGGDAEVQKIHLHARCASRNKTLLDPHSNILRRDQRSAGGRHRWRQQHNCTALRLVARGFGPVFTADRAKPAVDPARRIALDQANDPAGGSWHIEKLTDQLAQAAWKMFQEIEATGRAARGLKRGADSSGYRDGCPAAKARPGTA